ncbi:MAG: TetR/AcrR family transcriptional regulator [Sneathiella sp.]|nr:TetR/AcrR family transcriptional regulator [Sneathiella sp.]
MEDIQGVKPALQLRSRERRDKLLKAGMELLKENTILKLSIIDITGHCGYSVGTFYSRFVDKQSYFRAIQKAAVDLVLERVRAQFYEKDWSTSPNEEIFRVYIDILVDTVVSHTHGVVKESLTYVDDDENFWSPMRESADQLALYFIQTLKPRFKADKAKQSYNTTAFALQMMYATMAYATTGDHGPRRMDQPEFKDDLLRMLLLYIDIDDI